MLYFTGEAQAMERDDDEDYDGMDEDEDDEDEDYKPAVSWYLLEQVSNFNPGRWKTGMQATIISRWNMECRYMCKESIVNVWKGEHQNYQNRKNGKKKRTISENFFDPPKIVGLKSRPL